MKVRVLDIQFPFNGEEATIHPVLLQNQDELILVDCGYAGFLPLIEAAAEQQHGLALRELTAVIITHHDIDHVGGLFELREKYPSVKVYAPELEAPYISGERKSLRLAQAEELYDKLPEEQRAGALQFQAFLKTVRPVAVDHTFAYDESPSYWPGLRIINTPGHMPGHISIYLPGSKTLVAADAVVVENGELDIANPQFTLDLPAALASVHKLCKLDIEALICYHGGVVQGDISEKLTQLLHRYESR